MNDLIIPEVLPTTIGRPTKAAKAKNAIQRVTIERNLQVIYEGEQFRYFSYDEIHEILSDKLKTEDYDAWFLCFCLWHTGVRVSEALSVRTSSIDLMASALRVRTLKRKREHWRGIPLHQSFLGEYALYINNKGLRRDDQLFPIGRKTAYNWCRKACEMAGYFDGRAHPHSFRHSFSMNALRNGVPIPALKELLGHSDINKTLIYTRLTGADLQHYIQNSRF